MIVLVYSNRFVKNCRCLEGRHQKKLAALFQVLQNNPFEGKLHTKALVGELAGIYSFRITRDWRVLFRFDSPHQIALIDIAHRKDIYR